MKTYRSAFLPEARKEGLITKDVDGELLVYDRERDRAHCLNSTAATIWQLCDGRTTPREIAAVLSAHQSKQESSSTSSQSAAKFQPERILNIDEQIICLGIDELRRIHLLEEPKFSPSQLDTIRGMYSGMSRREAVRRIGLGAAITLPIIVSINVPTPVQAAVSCGARCKACSTGADCCSGVCAPPPVGTCPGGSPRCT
jgi:hypothetical protein